MKGDFKYQLEKGSRKHICPQCDKKTFVRCVNVDNNEYLPREFGRCDRESKCGYFRFPENRKNTNITLNLKTIANPSSHTIYYLPKSLLDTTIENNTNNSFVTGLTSNIPYPFPQNAVTEVCNTYKIGTIETAYMAGASTFPFIDYQQRINAIQVKLFDQNNHTTKTSFLHSIYASQLKKQKEELPQWLTDYQRNDKIINCLFGEHLLSKYPTNPIALVEAPKTAIYCTLYWGFPQSEDDFIWLAVFNKSSLSLDKISVLKGRKVVLFPDLNAYGEWSKKTENFKKAIPSSTFSISDYLETHATESEKSEGLDLADFLIKSDWREFRDERLKASQNIEENSKSMFAYSDRDERLILKMSFMDDYTVYPSLKSYQLMTSLPSMINETQFRALEYNRIDINTIKNNL